MKNMRKVIEICRLEDDVSTWEDITSKLFNGIKYDSLWGWHKNRNEIVYNLVMLNGAKSDVVNSSIVSNPKAFEKVFERGSDGRLITKIPFYIKRFNDPFSRVVIHSDVGVYLGEGVELLDSTIRTIAYIGDGAKIINSNIKSTKNKKGEASYVGRGATIEDAVQFCKSVVGSGVRDPVKHNHTYVHTAINGAIIGGSTGISYGVGFQSHLTRSEDTCLIDPVSGNKIVDISHNNKSRMPTIIGTNCRIGGGVQIASPLIVASGHVVGDKKEDGGKMFSGLVMSGEHRYVGKDVLDQRIVYQESL